MFRILLFSTAVVAVISGLSVVLPILEEGDLPPQVAVVVAARPPSCVISVHPTTISPGESASLGWVAENASSAELTELGSVPLKGGEFVAPAYSTTYVLTVSSEIGESAICTASLEVI